MSYHQIVQKKPGRHHYFSLWIIVWSFDFFDLSTAVLGFHKTSQVEKILSTIFLCDEKIIKYGIKQPSILPLLPESISSGIHRPNYGIFYIWSQLLGTWTYHSKQNGLNIELMHICYHKRTDEQVSKISSYILYLEFELSNICLLSQKSV